MFKKRAAIHTIILDRTSALTNNQLTVTSVWQPRLTSSKIASVLPRATAISPDPLDRALIEYTTAHGGTQSSHQSVHQFEFTQEQGMSGNLWHHGADFILAIKGMPEQIIDRCDLSDNERESILLQLQAQSASGTYVIALAQAVLRKPIKRLADLSTKHALEFVGFINVTVTIPSSTKRLIETAQSRGITTYILTGQHPSAGYQLASQLGVAIHPREVLDASALELLSEGEKSKQLAGARVIARANPMQKKHIAQLLKASGVETRRISSLDELRNALA